jgi:O-antigen/teichoic acid export membrane protein
VSYNLRTLRRGRARLRGKGPADDARPVPPAGFRLAGTGEMDDAASLKQTVLSAVGWATATRLMAQLANWAMTLASVRFLHPQDYGLMAVTMAMTGFLQSVSYVGITNAIVQSRGIGEDDMRSLFGLVLMINAACLSLLCGLAYPVSWFYREPRLIPLLQFASLSFVAIALQAIPRAILEKRLDLKTVTRIDLVANIAGGALVLLLAWAGAGVWALLFGMLSTFALRAIGFSLARPYFPRPRFTLANLSQILQTGGLCAVDNVLWMIHTSSDVFIIGKMLGADILGIYSVSKYVAALPVEKLALVINPIAFPAFARVQDDRGEALRYLAKAARLLAFLGFPMLLGVAATSPQIVAIALGAKWTAAATPLAILAMGMALRPVGFVIRSFLVGIGEFLASVKNQLVATVLFPAAFIIGSHWGIVGVCAAWLVAYPIQFLGLLRRVALVSGTSTASLIIPLLSPLAGSLIMYAAVRLASSLLPAGLGTWSTLLYLVATGVVVYFSYAFLFLRPLVAELAALARR